MKSGSLGAAGLLVFLTSCGGAAEMGGPTGGQLRVTAHTSGPIDAVVSYTVTVEGIAEQPVPVNGTATFSAIDPGGHHVELSGLPAGCTVAGDNPRTVTMPNRGMASTTFEITCVAA
ncbi:MAG TPA: hypothetical protein VJU17_10275 [Gemmatimonadales bacterium]|nr:hypothetical protein [Gemmatimonadales bacterium]